MDEKPPDEYFKDGISCLANNDLEGAFAAFEKAYESDGNAARYISYYGLCLAVYKGDVEKGIELCTRAIKLEFFRGEYYLNLGKAFLKAGKKQSAINTFRRGIRIDRDNLEIKKELEKMGIRARPVIPFLKRSNPINKYLGILFIRTIPRLLGKKKQEEE